MERLILRRLSRKTLIVLVCSVALVGAVGAYAYVLNSQPKAEVELKRVDVSNGLILEVDKTVYELGENVTITFTNNSTETVAFPSGTAWGGAIRDSEGRHIAPGLYTGDILYIPAGESSIWVWDQIDAGGEMVPPGIYTVEVTVYRHDVVEVIADLSISFEIRS